MWSVTHVTLCDVMNVNDVTVTLEWRQTVVMITLIIQLRAAAAGWLADCADSLNSTQLKFIRNTVARRLKYTHENNREKQTNKTIKKSKNNELTSQNKNSTVTVTCSSDCHKHLQIAIQCRVMLDFSHFTRQNVATINTRHCYCMVAL